MSDTTIRKVITGKWQCGFCGSGAHDRCIVGVLNQGSVLRCACKAHPASSRCLECGNTNPEQLTGWACTNPSACADAIAARSEENPLRKELETVRLLGGEARRRALMERQIAEIRAAVQESGIDEELGHDVAADLGRPRARRPRKAREPRPTEGKCICGGANAKCAAGPLATKGGKFAPGHDASLKSQLKKAVEAGDESARAKMIELGWERFLPAQQSAA
jgi:hypothetical protein